MNTFINRNMLSISLIFIIISIYMNSLNAISNINDNNTTNVTISSGSVSTKSLKKDCTNMSKEEVNENAYRLAIGILIAISGGFVSSFGLVFQKYAHKLNEPLPKEDRSSVKVVFGFITYIAGTAIFLAASPFAPQSILSALASVNLLGNAVWAPLLLKERVSKVDLLGLFFISGGIVIVVVFGNQCSLSYTADEIVRFFLAPGQLVYFIAVMSIVIGLILSIRLTENVFWEHFDYAMKLKRNSEKKKKARKIERLKNELVKENGNRTNLANIIAADDDEEDDIEDVEDDEKIVRRRTSVVEKLTYIYIYMNKQP